MKRLLPAIIGALLYMTGALSAQQPAGGAANIAGTLYASNFAKWTAASGTNGPFSWSSPQVCTAANVGGVTFAPFKVGSPIQVVDTATPANSEVINPLAVNINGSGCSITATTTKTHYSFYLGSATAGLQEAINYANGQPYVVVITSDFTRLGGTTSTIVNAKGNSAVSILDERNSVIVPYIWNAGSSTYVAQPFGGALNPGLNTQLVNYPSDGTAGGPTSITTDIATRKNLNVPRIFTGQVTNGGLNSDTYATGSGNNGIANALASPDCASGCRITVPVTSTDTEALPDASTLPLGTVITDYRNGQTITVANSPSIPATNLCGDHAQSIFCDVAIFNRTTTPDTQYQRNASLHHGSYTVFNVPSWNYGNAPNAYVPLWGTASVTSDVGIVNDRGISQMHSSIFTKHATGDFAAYGYGYGYSDGGQPDYSGEGITALTLEAGETSDFFHGTVGAGATTGTTSLPIVYNSGISTHNRNATTDGSFILDITKGTIAGSITGAATSVTGFPNNVFAMPVDTAVPLSTAAGNLGCELMEPNPILTPVSITCTINGIVGTNAGGFVAGQPTILAGDFPEQVIVSAVGTISSGSQSVTFTYLHPHGQSITSMWQGGLAGEFLSYDRSYAIDGFRTILHAYGALDANHIVMEAWRGNITPPSHYIAPVTLTSLSRVGGLVTASGSGSGYSVFNKIPSAIVSGCSDSTMNGTISAPNMLLNGTAITATWSQIGSDSTCASATLSMPSSYSGFHLYPGVEVRGPSIAAPGNAPVEPNYIAWTQGDTLEEPHHPFISATSIRTVHTVNSPDDQNSATGGFSQTYYGAGISGSYHPFDLSMTNPCSWYVGCGGTLVAPAFMILGSGTSSSGANGGAIVLKSLPLAGAPIFHIGCAASEIGGCSNKDLFYLFQLDSVGNITVNPTTHEMGGLSYNAGSGNVSGFLLQAIGAFCGLSTAGGAADTCMSRMSAGKFGLGTSRGAHDGTLELAHLIADTDITMGSASGCATFTAGVLSGTGVTCGSGSLPTGAANQMLYYAGAGTTVTPLTLGANLSITAGVLNASSTAATNFNALTSGTNTTAAMTIGTGASLGVTGSGTIAATSAPYSGLTGTVPTWNQSTTGNAATASALAATPTLCSTGLAPTGILANGNATGCAAFGNTTSTTLVTGTIPKATGPNAVGNSSISDDGTTVSTTEPISSAGYRSSGSTQGFSALGVGTGTVSTTGWPTNYVGWIGPASGTPAFLLQLPSTAPTAGQVMAFAVPTTVNGVSQSVASWITPSASVTFPWSCQPGLGDGLNAITAGTYLQTSCYNDTGQTVTLTGLKCYADGGTPTMNATNGAGTGLLTGAVTCSSSFAAGTQSATTTIAAGDYIKFTFVASGTAKQATFVVTGTHP